MSLSCLSLKPFTAFTWYLDEGPSPCTALGIWAGLPPALPPASLATVALFQPPSPGELLLALGLHSCHSDRILPAPHSCWQRPLHPRGLFYVLFPQKAFPNPSD